MARIVECVPNFSEGRDAGKIKQITSAVEAVSGVTLLNVEPGADTNRTVVTFVGEPEAVLEAAFQGIARASALIDMSTHRGAHPACPVRKKRQRQCHPARRTPPTLLCRNPVGQ